jgi:hypothetical protein
MKEAVVNPEAVQRVIFPKIEGFTFSLSPDGTTCIGTTDWMSVVTQTGRLDLISVLLAIIAILLVIAALPAYRLIQARCERIARDAIDDMRIRIGQQVESLTIQELEERLPSLAQDYLDLARNAATADEANQIAAAQEGDGRG